MKLLVCSHACITPINQSFYADLEEETQWKVSLVVPSNWKTEYVNRTTIERWPTFHGTIHPVDVWLSGDVPRHVYRSRFVSLLRQEQPDAIYVHHEPYGFATAQIYWANQRSVRRPIGFYAAQNILKNYPPPVRQVEKWVMQHSDFAFPVTQSALEVLEAKGYRARAEILPLAVNADLYQPSPDWGAARRVELGIAPDRVLLGYLGRFVEEKGLQTLLRALERIPDLPWELLLIGNGPYEASLREQVKSMGALGERVRFQGYVPHEEAPRCMSMFDILVLPSETRAAWREQFGRVLVEAMACGTPVIGSDSGEIPNVIRATGAGEVFPEGNVDGLAEAVRSLVSQPALRQQLADQGRSSVVQMYDQRFLARKFAEVIEAAMRDKQAGVQAARKA